MNAQTLSASSGTGRLAEKVVGGFRPFRTFADAEDFFVRLSSNVPTARRLIGRLRAEAKGDKLLVRWIRKICARVEGLERHSEDRRAREFMRRYPDLSRGQDDYVQESEEFECDPSLIEWALAGASS